MSDEGAESAEATAVVRWLLEGGVAGLGLTKTHALQRALVREAAERWPQWWDHELFGPPNREAELPVLEVTHAALREMRLLRRQRETLRTTPQGRALLADPDALLEALHDDISLGGDFQASAWSSIESVLHEYGPLPDDQLAVIVASLLRNEGWSESGGAPIDPATLRGELHPLLWLAEGYGLLRRSPREAPLTLEAHTRRAPARRGPWAGGHHRCAGRHRARVRRRAGRRARRPRPAGGARAPAAHSTARRDPGGVRVVRRPSVLFWLDGRFWGDEEVTSPLVPDEAEHTADVPIAELHCVSGSGSRYVFDFGDEWRVRLTVRERIAAEAGDHPRVLELRGTPPPQYAAIGD